MINKTNIKENCIYYCNISFVNVFDECVLQYTICDLVFIQNTTFWKQVCYGHRAYLRGGKLSEVKITVFWDVTPYSLIEIDRRF